MIGRTEFCSQKSSKRVVNMALKLSGQFRLAPPVCVKIGEGPDLGIDRIEAFVGRHRSVDATHDKLEEP